jgi:hypothetical protein
MHLSLQALMNTFRHGMEDLDAEKTQLHPHNDPAQWSVQQVVGHLVMTYRSTGNLLQDRLSKGRPVARKPRLREWLLQRLILTLGHFPKGISAPAEVQPARAEIQPADGAALLCVLQSELEKMEGALEECRRQFGAQRIATHFALGPMSVEQWVRFHAVHGMHHRKQVSRVRAAIGAPPR